MPKHIMDTEFESEVIRSEIPAVVDFWAEWCAPCKLLEPAIEKLADELRGKVKFYKLNVDDNPQTTSNYGIMSIPTLIIFKDGKPVNQLVGVRPKEELKKFIEENI
jgi:thioredoxin 1